MPFVNTRWLGGMLTNFQTIHTRLRRLKELREMERSGAFEYLPKKEVLKLRHEKEKLDRNLSGIQDMERLPDAVFVIDTKREHIAVKEARKLGIPVVAIVDTNCDPDEVDYVIPGNDDAIRVVLLIAKVVADAIQEGQYLAYRGMAGPTSSSPSSSRSPPAGAVEPAAEESRPVQLSEEEAGVLRLRLRGGPRRPAERGVGATDRAAPAAGRRRPSRPLRACRRPTAEPRSGGRARSRRPTASHPDPQRKPRPSWSPNPRRRPRRSPRPGRGDAAPAEAPDAGRCEPPAGRSREPATPTDRAAPERNRSGLPGVASRQARREATKTREGRSAT